MQNNTTDFTNIDDETLVEKIRNENQEYYLFLMQRYEQKILRYIRRISFLPEEDARDVVQDVFIKTYTHLNDFDVSLSFSSWIYRIAHNEAVSALRKHSRFPKARDSGGGESEDDLENPIMFVPDPTNLEFEMDVKMTQREVMNILEGLSPDHRTVLILKFVEDKSYQEMSDILKKPIGTISTLVHRAKKQFKKNAEEKKLLERI